MCERKPYGLISELIDHGWVTFAVGQAAFGFSEELSSGGIKFARNWISHCWWQSDFGGNWGVIQSLTVLTRLLALLGDLAGEFEFLSLTIMLIAFEMQKRNKLKESWKY